MVRCQLLWLRGRQSLQPLMVQYQPSQLCQLLWLRGWQSLRPLQQPRLVLDLQWL
jgi:hypothetical protein